MKRKPISQMSTAAELRNALVDATDTIKAIRARGLGGQLLTQQELAEFGPALVALFKVDDLLLKRLAAAEATKESNEL